MPSLGDTLGADTEVVVQDVAKHDMAEALEHVVRGIGEVEDELREAFIARDKGRTGALGGSDFKASGWRCAAALGRRCFPKDLG